MTKEEKIALALMMPFLICLAAAVVYATYCLYTDVPWALAVIAVFIPAAVGFFILTYDPEDIM